MTEPAHDDANAPARAITLDDLPDAGSDRYWRVGYNPKSNAKPMRVELIEKLPGARRLGTVIGYENTIAHHTNIIEAADLVLRRVGHYALYVGEYRSDQ